jgi:hypothetical protein
MASAPTLHVARRDVVAVEHPMVVKDLDKALKTFGLGVETTGRPFRRVSVHGHVFRLVLSWSGKDEILSFS